MRNNQTSPCYDRKNHKDCPRRSPDCRWHCKAWKEYEKARNVDYDTPDYDNEDRQWRTGKGQKAKLRRQQRRQNGSEW